MIYEQKNGEAAIRDIDLDDIIRIVADHGCFLNGTGERAGGNFVLPHPSFLDPRNIMGEAGASEACLAAYNAPEALKYRQRALLGIQAANDSRFADLLKLAANFTGDEIETVFIADRFAAIARDGHKALKRLADIAKDGGHRAGERAGEESHSGQILRELCLFLKNHGRLPTKLELRKNSGLADGKNEVEIYRREAGKLGLAHLPEA